MKTKLFFPLALLASFVFLQSNNKSSESPPAGALEKISTALPTEAAAKPMKARKLLVFSATAGFRHASIATGKVALSELGKKTGAFEAVISDDLANFEPDAIQQFDAICFLSTTQDVLSPHPQVLKKMSDEEKKAATERSMRLRKSLMDFIESGKGFVGIHAATDTLYNMPEYGRMIGGYFNGHPWNAAAEVQIDVEKGVEKHPLAVMFEGQSMNFKEEIYQHKDSAALECREISQGRRHEAHRWRLRRLMGAQPRQGPRVLLFSGSQSRDVLEHQNPQPLSRGNSVESW
jgi:type 1 glutamine amidotransferase